jgi:hypothetical protein
LFGPLAQQLALLGLQTRQLAHGVIPGGCDGGFELGDFTLGLAVGALFPALQAGDFLRRGLSGLLPLGLELGDPFLVGAIARQPLYPELFGLFLGDPFGSRALIA